MAKEPIPVPVGYTVWFVYTALLLYSGMITNRRHLSQSRWSHIKWATEELFVGEEFRDGMALTYKDIANRDEFYEWFDNVALPTIYGKSLPYRIWTEMSRYQVKVL